MHTHKHTHSANINGAGTDLGSIDTDNSVGVARTVIVIGHVHCNLACRQPVLLCLRVDLEHMRFRGKDGLLPVTEETKTKG